MTAIELNEKALDSAARVFGSQIEWNSEPGLEELTEMAAKVVRAYLAAEPVYRCNICGGVVDFTNVTAPTVHLGGGAPRKS